LPKILFLTSRFPYPLNKGDQLRVYFQLKSLGEKDEVHLIAISERPISEEARKAVEPFCKSVHVFLLPRHKRIASLVLSPFRKLPLQVALFYSSKIDREIKSLIAQIAPDFIHCHLIRTAEYVRTCKHIPKSLDFMDAFGIGMRKRKLIETNPFKRLLYQYEEKQLFRYEKDVFNFFDNFGIISTQDREGIDHFRAKEIKIVPNGVDFNSFYPRNDIKEYDLLFMGNLDYPPNTAAVYFLIREIIPLVRQQIPGIRLLIAGSGATKEMKKHHSDQVVFRTNFEHISDSIAISRIMLAPMFISIGLQNKILQAMAMKVPCIVTRSANNAIGAPNNMAIVEANTALEFCAQILDLLKNESRAVELAQKGYDFVKGNYSWASQNELLRQLIKSSQ
jgi:glycosyltransferase involved in cell wall biosynthesis